MLHFICPHCNKALHIPATYLGMKGRCNKCGGHIALVGTAHATGPQMASAIGVLKHEPDPFAEPATERQLEYLRGLGVDQGRLKGLDKARASDWIRQLRERRQNGEPPTEKQLQHLRRLGAPDRLVQRLKSKADAGALIEEMHLLPTASQLALLRKLGARGEQLARIRTRGEASAVIEEMMQQR